MRGSSIVALSLAIIGGFTVNARKPILLVEIEKSGNCPKFGAAELCQSK